MLRCVTHQLEGNVYTTSINFGSEGIYIYIYIYIIIYNIFLLRFKHHMHASLAYSQNRPV